MKDTLFAKFMCPLYLTAQNREVTLKNVSTNNSKQILYFVVDDSEVRVSYDKNGLKLFCSCEGCGKALIARESICSRRLSVLNYLWMHKGIVSEIEVKKK